jgi:hypothetical protein
MHATTSGSSRVLYATLSCSGGFGFGPLPSRAPPRFLAASFFCFMLFCFKLKRPGFPWLTVAGFSARHFSFFAVVAY